MSVEKGRLRCSCNQSVNQSHTQNGMKQELLQGRNSMANSNLVLTSYTNSIGPVPANNKCSAENKGQVNLGMIPDWAVESPSPTSTSPSASPEPSKASSGVWKLAKGAGSAWARRTCRPKTFRRRLPLLSWLPNYSFSKLISDMIAGFTVGLTILPQGLAYATVAGLEPQYGLYSGFVGCFVYIFLGSTKEVTIGPTAVLAIITYGYVHDKPSPLLYAIFLCFFTGVVTLLMGIFQLGFIINFISRPVTSAFSSAAALTIAATQLKGLLGLKIQANGFMDTWEQVGAHISETRLWDALLGLGCSVFIMILRKLKEVGDWFSEQAEEGPPGRFRRCIGSTIWFISTARNALTVILTALVAYIIICKHETVPFSLTGDINAGLPPFAVPPFSVQNKNETVTFHQMASEMSSAFIVLPLLALMEHISIAKACAGARPVDASQEMLTIGVSNIIGSFFGSMPVTGSFSRTTVNHSSGVQSPLGGFVTGVLVLLALQFLTPSFYYIPKAALSAVIICAVILMVEFRVLLFIWRTKKMDLIPAIATFVVALLVGLEFGILTGLGISVIYLLYYAAIPGVKAKKAVTSAGAEFVLLTLDRSLVFPSVGYIRNLVSKAGLKLGESRLPVVLDCHHIQFADFTAAQGIKDLIEDFDKREQLLVFWRLKSSLIRIINGVRPKDFIHCKNEEELEYLLHGKKMKCGLSTVSSTFGDSGMSLASSDISNPTAPV